MSLFYVDQTIGIAQYVAVYINFKPTEPTTPRRAASRTHAGTPLWTRGGLDGRVQLPSELDRFTLVSAP